MDSAADTLKSKFPRLKALGAIPSGSHLALGAEEGSSRGALVGGSAASTYPILQDVAYMIQVYYMMRDAIST